MSIKLITSVKDEGPFLLEWIAHHKIIGFDEIMVAYNDCTDGSAELLELLATHGQIQTYSNDVPNGKSAQKYAYEALFQTDFVQSADWLAILDADEFLNIHIGDGKISSFVERFSDVDFIALNWMTFGDLGNDYWQEGLVCEQFTYAKTRGARFNQGIKSITRSPKDFEKITNHHPGRPNTDRPTVFANGKGSRFEHDFQNADSPFCDRNFFQPEYVDHTLAQINHYAIKSIDSYCLRVARGRGYGAQVLRHSTQYFARRSEFANQLETSIFKYNGEVQAKMAQLMALPNVAEMVAHIHNEYRARLKKVRAKLENGEFDMASYQSILNTQN